MSGACLGVIAAGVWLFTHCSLTQPGKVVFCVQVCDSGRDAYGAMKRGTPSQMNQIHPSDQSVTDVTLRSLMSDLDAEQPQTFTKIGNGIPTDAKKYHTQG